MLSNLAIFQDIFIKSSACLLVSFLVNFFLTKKYISYANRCQNLFQPIRDDGPQTHQNKCKTPTMGGFFIILSTLLSTLLFADLSNNYILLILFAFVTFGGIGLYDDLAKVLKNNCRGLRGSIKIVIQFTITASIYLCLITIEEYHLQGQIFLPLCGGVMLAIGTVFYVLFVNFVIVGSANSVNLTDGLDGLVSVPAIINLLCLITLCYIAACPYNSKSHGILFVQDSSEIIYFCFALIGSILAFLRFNLRPAKIFMGDVGSLAIGATLGLIAVILKQEFIFFIISILFVSETISVILQVGSYKIRKKRIFLMAPLHHHFEKLGWSEQKVVRAFWFSSLVFALSGMSIILF